MTTNHSSGEFTSHDGTRIFHQEWAPADQSGTDAALAIIHGYGEHGGRYAHVGEFFASHGFQTAAMDHRSHGRSEGKDTFFRSIDDCVGDVDLFVRQLKEQAPGLPIFVLAHSMGGLITTRWVEEYQPELNGVLLTGPAVLLDESISPFLVKISGIIGRIAPRLKTITLDGEAVSRDPEVVRKYNEDPLNYRGGIPAATGAALNAGIKAVHENLSKFSLPVRLMHGSADRLARPDGSEKLLAGFSSGDKELVPYEGLYHEILNEPENRQIMKECLDWMTHRF